MKLEQATPVDSVNGRSSKFHVGSWVRQTPEEGQKTYWPKRGGNKDNHLKTLNDKKKILNKRRIRIHSITEIN